jgi:hypothetical protein
LCPDPTLRGVFSPTKTIEVFLQWIQLSDDATERGDVEEILEIVVLVTGHTQFM